jgi:hypothetical protein
MDAAQVDAALEVGLTAAAALLVTSGGALGWLTLARRRRLQRETSRALAGAEAQKRDAVDALARASREYSALREATHKEVEAGVSAERTALLRELEPVHRALAELLVAAPAAHVLTPGLTLVARQLESVLSSARASPERDAHPEGVAHQPAGALEPADPSDREPS